MYLGRLAKWFMFLSDPQCDLRVPASRPPSFAEMAQILDLSIIHGTTPAIISNLKQPQASSRLTTEQFSQLSDKANEILLPQCARAIMLRKYLECFTAAQVKAGIQAIEMKGADFADHIYPHVSMRPFTDIDILARKQDINGLSEIVKTLGFDPMELENLRHEDEYGEKGFLLNNHGVDVMLELHWNLVNSPAVRRGVSVEFDDVVENGQTTPEGRLIIAAVHASTSHQYDRIKFFFDILQAIRTGKNKFDIKRLREIINKTGSGKIMSMACRLTKTLTGENCGIELAGELGLPNPGLLDRLLMNRRVISPTSKVILRKARMCGYRHRLKNA